MSLIELRSPTLSDLEYIACHMREADQREIYNVVSHNNPFLLARQTFDAIGMGSAVAAIKHGRPAAVLGFIVRHTNVCSGFAYGTASFPEVALALTRYALRVMKPALLASGIHRIDCQSRVDHVEAHAWLGLLGFKLESVFRRFGSDGSDYINFVALKE